MTGHPIYRVWQGMRTRCSASGRPGFKNYGGRGITVCKRWQDFQAFREDMGAGWRPGLTIERIDNNGHYEPGNCRWATRKEQGRNRRDNVILDSPWGRVTLMEAAERSGIPYGTLTSRRHYGRELFTAATPALRLASA
jgi:hypothetical protein